MKAYGQGKTFKAREDLGRALLGGSTQIFNDEDPKYFSWIMKQMPAPEEGGCK